MIGLLLVAAAGLGIGAVSNIGIERLPPVPDLRPPPLGRGAPARVQLRRAVVALLVAGLFALAFDRFSGEPFRMIATAGFATVFVVLAFIDLETLYLPDRIIFPALLLALVVSPFWPHLELWEGVAGAAVGYAVFFPLAWYGDRVDRDIMGWGDVKLSALLGAVLGLQFLLVGLYLGVLVGGVAGIAALIPRRLGFRVAVLPFGPSLALGGLAALFYGRPLVDWVARALS